MKIEYQGVSAHPSRTTLSAVSDVMGAAFPAIAPIPTAKRRADQGASDNHRAAVAPSRGIGASPATPTADQPKSVARDDRRIQDQRTPVTTGDTGPRRIGAIARLHVSDDHNRRVRAERDRLAMERVVSGAPRRAEQIPLDSDFALAGYFYIMRGDDGV